MLAWAIGGEMTLGNMFHALKHGPFSGDRSRHCSDPSFQDDTFYIAMQYTFGILHCWYTNQPASRPQALGLPTRAELAEQKRQVVWWEWSYQGAVNDPTDVYPKIPKQIYRDKMPTSSKTMVFYGWKLVELYPRGLDNWGLGVTFTCRDKCRLDDIELDSLTWLIVMYLCKKYDDLVWRFSPFLSACSICHALGQIPHRSLTYIAPEKWWLEDYFPRGKITFQGLC